MTTMEAFEEIRHDPRLPDFYERIGEQLKNERKRREQFYRDITPEQKIEFIDGEVILHSPAKNRHLDVTGNTFNLLKNFVTKKQLGTVKCEKCLTVFPRNDYEPDIVYFGPEKAATLTVDTMKFPIPDLVVEVLSSSTESRDRGIKFTDYAANGVKEYWIIDPENEILEQYFLENGDFRLHIKASKTSRSLLQSRAISDLEIPVEAIFDEAANLAALEKLFH